MHPVLVKIGTISVYSWGFMLAVAVILAIFGISRSFDKEGYERETALDLILLIVVAGIIGARISYIIVYEWDVFTVNPGSFVCLTEGFTGLIWYGAVVGGLIPFILYSWKKGWNMWKIADILAPYSALGYALVRIGCFLNGCCYGKTTTSSWGVVFPLIDSSPRYPTQIYSSFINFLIFFFLIWYYPRRKFPGQVALLYVITYSIYRFIIEYFRETLIMYGPFTIGQVYTLILLAAAAGVYFFKKLRYRKLNSVQ